MGIKKNDKKAECEHEVVIRQRKEIVVLDKSRMTKSKQ